MNIFRKHARHKFVIVISALILHSLTAGNIASDPEILNSNTFVNATDQLRPSITAENCCGNSTAKKNDLHRIEIQYKTTVIKNEYIVRFGKYSLPYQRQQHIEDALDGSKVIA